MTDDTNVVKDLVEEESKEPNECYTFTYSESELDEAYKFSTAPKRALFIAGLYCLLGSIYMQISGAAPSGMIYTWIAFGILCLFLYALTRSRDKKAIEANKKRSLASVYTYKVYDSYFTVTVENDGEKNECKVDYNKIGRISSKENLVICQFNNRLFIIKKEGLPSNSPLLHLPYIKKMDFDSKKATGTKKKISIALFVSTLLSAHIAAMISMIISEGMTILERIPWGFLIAIPIPLSSLIYGLNMKKKGYSNYRKNVIAGSILLMILLVFFVATLTVPMEVNTQI